MKANWTSEWAGGGDVQKCLWVPSKNLRLTFPVCVRHESAQCSGHGRFVCQWCFSFWFPYGNWDFLFLYLLQHFLPRQFLNVRSVHVLCEGNVSEWWERIIAIYSLENTTASLLSLPVLSQDVECATEWMCQEKGEGVVKFFASLGG